MKFQSNINANSLNILLLTIAMEDTDITKRNVYYIKHEFHSIKYTGYLRISNSQLDAYYRVSINILIPTTKFI